MLRTDTELIMDKLKGISDDVTKKKWEKTNKFFHYTSLPKLFAILENDGIWASNIRFSNDSTEEKLIYDISCDDYVICFCAEGDQLSQWRGYCNEGGASIGFHIGNYQKYSVLYSDYEYSGKYIVYENAPLPVLYVDPIDKNNKGELELCVKWLENNAKKDIDKIVPYIKNALFYEEKESRLAFINKNDNLSNCIRFRDLDNGVKVPYIVIKSGDVNMMHANCGTDPDDFNDKKLQDIYDNLEDIMIMEGQDQYKIYFEIEKRVKEFAENNQYEDLINIYCQGHLAIDEIIVAPTADRSRVAEQIRRYCKSKYWLRNVEVKESKIPFVK